MICFRFVPLMHTAPYCCTSGLSYGRTEMHSIPKTSPSANVNPLVALRSPQRARSGSTGMGTAAHSRHIFSQNLPAMQDNTRDFTLALVLPQAY